MHSMRGPASRHTSCDICAPETQCAETVPQQSYDDASACAAALYVLSAQRCQLFTKNVLRVQHGIWLCRQQVSGKVGWALKSLLWSTAGAQARQENDISRSCSLVGKSTATYTGSCASSWPSILRGLAGPKTGAQSSASLPADNS